MSAEIDGDHVGRFRIIRKLGQGGHGIVFLAFDPQLGRNVAIKIPSVQTALSSSGLQRLIIEARSLALLKHVNIIDVLEVSEEGPPWYIVQSYCDGPSLKTWLGDRQEPVPDRVAAEIVRDLSDAVHYAHSKGILHRDLKLANVLLQPIYDQPAGYAAAPEKTLSSGGTNREQNQFTPKLTDFGVAKIIDGVGSNALTMTADVVGTAQYMAPEQAEARTSDVGWHTDVYGLGTILYELLTGSPPFTGNSSVAVLRQVVENDPKPPRQFRKTISGDLEAICLKCLEKGPSQRYESAADLRADLERYLGGYPVTAHPLTAPRRVIRWCRRKPLGMTLILLIVLVGLGALASGWWHSLTLQKALARAKAETRRGLGNR